MDTNRWPKLQQIKHKLVAPWAEITDPDEYFFAQLLATMLLILPTLGLIVSFLPPLVYPQRPISQEYDFLIVAGSMWFWIIAYLLVRAGYHRLITSILIAGATIVVFAIVLIEKDYLDLIYLTLVVIFTGAVFSMRTTLLLFFTYVLGFLLVPLAGVANLEEVISRPLSFFLACSLLVAFTTRYRLQQEENKRKALAASEARYRGLLEAAFEGVAIHQQCQIVACNAGLAEMFGYTRDELIGMSLLTLIQESFRDSVWQNIQAGIERPYEVQGISKDGSIRYIEIIARNQPVGNEMEQIVAIRDITQRKLAETRLRHFAYHDPLTNLPNRASLLAHLRDAIIDIHKNPGRQFALLFLDFDRFKIVNDSLGHITGDQLLIIVADRLRQCLQPEDLLARLGGDEFVILRPNLSGKESVIALAEQIQAALVQPIILQNHPITMTVSIGIVISDIGYRKAEDVLRDADIAMYQAKAKGRSRYEFFDVSMRQSAMTHLIMEADLRQALEQDELQVFYQPIISLRNGRLSGFEALVRWRREDGRFISPGHFVLLAEETGLITTLDWWIIRHALYQLHQWNRAMPDLPPLTLNVNLSSRTFESADFLPNLLPILQQNDILPGQLRLEITERALLKNAQTVRDKLTTLLEHGVHVQIDDFGTGYSSLSYLQYFPISAIKIDRAFVSQLDIDENSFYIAESIIRMAHRLGLETIAEGVENDRQLDLLKSLGCEYIQGFFISGALSVEDATVMIEHLHTVPDGIH